MSNIIDVTPKTEKELADIYKSVTQSLNGLSVSEASRMLERIRMNVRHMSIIHFSPDYLDPMYDSEPCHDKDSIRVFIE
jgi:hypothetical protein